MRQRGFIGFLLSNPLLLLSAALGIALIATGIGARVYKSQRDSARAEAVQEQSRRVAFEAETARLGEEAKAKADAEIKRQKEVNDGLQKRLRALGNANAELRAHVERLRERPPERPDGSIVPTAACGPEGTDGKGAGQRVPLEDYRALEARAAYDAQTVMLWREWSTSQRLAP